jgi:carboxylate-amine ligase
VIGFDLVRGADGELRVLEDNLRTPSGLTYAIAARRVVDRVLPGLAPAGRLEPDGALAMFGTAVEAELEGASAGIAVLLSDGPENSAFYEHRALSRALGIPLVGRRDLRQCGRELRVSVDGADAPVGVILRRTDLDQLRDTAGSPTWLGELFAAAARAGVAIVNAPGAGVADDKLTHAYVEDMIRFYLGEEPLVASVRTLDLGDPEMLDEVLGRLGELVVKPRSALGGDGVVIGVVAGAEELDRVRGELRERPRDYVAQELVALSTHPTVCGGRLEPRHVDLRVFAIAGEVAPAPLTRVALRRGELVVNSSRDGGAKDTWVEAGG